MDKRNYVELIKLEALGCIGLQDYASLKAAKQKDKDFPMKELGEYQNLTALLSTTLNIETPAHSLKEEVVLKLANLMYKDEIKLEEQEEAVKEIENELHEIENELEKKTKLPKDFIPLKDPDLSQLHILYQDEAFKSKAAKDKTRHIEKEKLIEKEKTKEVVKEKDKAKEKEILKEKEKIEEIEPSWANLGLAVEDKQTNIRTNKHVKTDHDNNIGSLKKSLKRSFFISGGLLIITLALVVVVFLKFSGNGSSSNELNKKDITEKILSDENNKVPQPVEPQEQQMTVSAGEINEVEKSDNEKTPGKTLEEAKTTTKQSGPPPLPKSLEPIEAPLVNVDQNTQVQDTKSETELKTESQTSNPPKEEKKLVEEPTYFVAVEEMPQPIGGLKGIQGKIVYPEIAKRMGVEGKVHVRAYVDESGNVTNVELIKGIGAGCDEEALDAVLKTKFSPGKQRGRPVKVQVTIPINFKL